MAVFEINLNKVKNNYLSLKKFFPNAIIAYALKANYDKKILRTLSSIGCAAEVCSEYEYQIAINNGFKKIIRNGFNPSGEAWLTNISDINDKNKIKGLIGARIQLSNKSKLGISDELIINNQWDCISFHTRDNFNQALSKAINLAEKTGAKIIDVGGGIREELDEERIKLLSNINQQLIIEPGRYLVANACRVITRVISVKDDKAVIDVGMNFLNKFSNSKYIVKSLKEGRNNHSYKIFGPVPTDIDNIGVYNLPELSVGDKLIIENAGAYTLSMASNWTHRIPIIRYVT